MLILAVLALLAASGVVWAAATATTVTVVQIPLALTDPGTTWTEGGITHLRDAVLPTIVGWYYDGEPPETTFVELVGNSDRDANGAGHVWGTWSEYDIETGDPLGGGTWQGTYTCWELQGGSYAHGWVNVLGWRLGPDGEWGQVKGTLVLYSEPEGLPYPIANIGEVRFLVPGGE